MNITEQQLAVIAQQLGRKPRGLLGIAHQRGHVPVVLKMQPWFEKTPFPTLFWLSSKDLHQAISQIETAGFVKTLQQRLQEDSTLAKALYDDNCRYRDKRNALLSAADKAQIKALGLEAIFATGIGGIKDFNSVRCLHMHYAQHLAERNCIGALLDEEFSLNECVIRR